MSRIMYKLEVCSEGTTGAQPRLFHQNRPTAETHVTENRREGKNVSVFGKSLDVYGCTPTHEVVQHEELHIRQELFFFSKHVRGLMMLTPFESKTRSVSSCALSSR